MKYEEIKLSELVDAISDTRKIDKDKVVLVNTSDVLAGEVLNHTHSENCNLKGQFKKRFKKDDILYSEIRPANKRFAYIDFNSEDYIASTKLMVLRRNSDKVTNRYLYYCLTNDLFVERMQHFAEARSGTFPQITFDVLKMESIYLPSIDNQNKVTSILDNINNKIRLNNKINNNLHELMKIKFNNCIDNLEEYEESLLSKIANYKNGLAMQKFRPIDESGLPVIKIKEMNSGITSETERCRSDIDSDVIIDNGDILFAWSGTLCMSIWCGGRAGLNQHIFKVTSDKYPKWFYYFWTLKHLDNFIEIAAGKATTMGHIKRTELDKAIVKIPNEKIMEKMDKIFTPMLNKYVNNCIESKSLSELRDTLLPKLMNGEIDLDNIEI